MHNVLVRIEKTDTGYSAYAPDIDGVIATGNTRIGVEASMDEALRMHLLGMIEDGEEIPKCNEYIAFVDTDWTKTDQAFEALVKLRDMGAIPAEMIDQVNNVIEEGEA